MGVGGDRIPLRLKHLHCEPEPLTFHRRCPLVTMQPPWLVQRPGQEHEHCFHLSGKECLHLHLSCINKHWNWARKETNPWSESKAYSDWGLPGWWFPLKRANSVTYTHHAMKNHRGTGQEARVSLHHFHKPSVSSHFPSCSSCPSVASPTVQQNCLCTSRHLDISKAMLIGKQTFPIESPLALATAHFCFAERYKPCCLSRAWWEHVCILKSSGASHFPWVLP